MYEVHHHQWLLSGLARHTRPATPCPFSTQPLQPTSILNVVVVCITMSTSRPKTPNACNQVRPFWTYITRFKRAISCRKHSDSRIKEPSHSTNPVNCKHTDFSYHLQPNRLCRPLSNGMGEKWHDNYTAGAQIRSKHGKWVGDNHGPEEIGEPATVSSIAGLGLTWLFFRAAGQISASSL